MAADKPGPGAYRSSSEFGYYDEGSYLNVELGASSVIRNSRMSKRNPSTRNNWVISINSERFLFFIFICFIKLIKFNKIFYEIYWNFNWICFSAIMK